MAGALVGAVASNDEKPAKTAEGGKDLKAQKVVEHKAGALAAAVASDGEKTAKAAEGGKDLEARKVVERKAGAKLGGTYGRLAKAAELTPEQIEQVGAAVAASNKPLDEWTEGEKGQRLAQLRKEMATLLAERKVIETESKKNFDKTLAAIITPAQYAAWKASELETQVMGGYKRFDLSQDQQEKIKAACAASAKQLVAGEAEESVVKALNARIASEILNEQQRAKLPTSVKPKGEELKSEKPKGDEPKAVKGESVKKQAD
jgi:hypothetical protein